MRLVRQLSYTTGVVWESFKKLRKHEIVKIDMLHNPDGAMRSIMYVLDDFTGFGSFLILLRIFSKMDLKIKKIDFLHMVYFQNPEIESKWPVSKFFRSEVI